MRSEEVRDTYRESDLFLMHEYLNRMRRQTETKYRGLIQLENFLERILMKAQFEEETCANC